MDEIRSIIGISVCELSRDGSSAKVWLECSDGATLKLSVAKQALPAVAAKLGYESIRRSTRVATGQPIGPRLLEASALPVAGADQVNIGLLLRDGALLQFQIDDAAAIAFAVELVAAAQESARRADKPIQ